MPYIEDFEEFKKRMNCPYVASRKRYLFENGGQSNGGLGQHTDPPDDPQSLLTLQIEYLAVRLEQEETKFNDCKGYIMEQARFHSLGAGPPPAEDAFSDLARFKKNVFTYRDQLAAKQEELSALLGPDHQSPRERKDEQREQSRRVANEAITRALRLEI